MKEYLLEQLENRLFGHPDSYGGPDFSDYIIVYGRNRESTILENVNYDCILEDLTENLKTEFDQENVFDVRQGHWAVGWIELILVHKDCSESVLTHVIDIVRALENYPVYDENKYSEAQCEAIFEHWYNASLSDKIEMCQDAHVSIFSARYEAIPDQVFDNLQQSEIFY